MKTYRGNTDSQWANHVGNYNLALLFKHCFSDKNCKKMYLLERCDVFSTTNRMPWNVVLVAKNCADDPQLSRAPSSAISPPNTGMKQSDSAPMIPNSPGCRLLQYRRLTRAQNSQIVLFFCLSHNSAWTLYTKCRYYIGNLDRHVYRHVYRHV